MAEVDGGGSQGYTGYTFEELRTGMRTLRPDFMRVGSNQWGDLRRRLDERIGTLRVMIHRLAPDWESPAGTQALGKLRAHLTQMQALSKTARWNEILFDDLYDTYSQEMAKLRKLEEQPKRQAEVTGSVGHSTDALTPAQADTRQPAAAQIVYRMYGKLALTTLSLRMPSDPDYKPGPDPGGGTGVPPGPAAAPGSGGGQPGRSGPSAGAPPVVPASKRGSTGSGPAGSGGWPAAALRPGVGVPPTTPAGGRAGASSPAASGSTGAPGGARGVPGVGGTGAVPGSRVPGGVTRGGVLGPGGGAGGTGVPASGPGAPGGGGPGGTPASRAGGPPGPGTPGTEAHGSGGPRHPGGVPHAPGGAGAGAGGGGGRPGRRTRYEQGDPELFVDKRARAKPVIGQQPDPGRPVDAGPGVIGTQKQKPAAPEHTERLRPAPKPAATEGFPDEVKDGSFTRRDGARFTVRRRSGS
ncbi:MAG: hypothetical protein ACRDT6_03070 [Micromonosporaceae bacterium]